MPKVSHYLPKIESDVMFCPTEFDAEGVIRAAGHSCYVITDGGYPWNRRWNKPRAAPCEDRRI
jgi:hypothetical protein